MSINDNTITLQNDRSATNIYENLSYKILTNQRPWICSSEEIGDKRGWRGKGVISIFLVVARSHQVHQRLDEKADRISGGLDNLHRPLVSTMSQVHAIDLDYSIPDLKVNVKEKERILNPFFTDHVLRFFILCWIFFFSSVYLTAKVAKLRPKLLFQQKKGSLFDRWTNIALIKSNISKISELSRPFEEI